MCCCNRRKEVITASWETRTLALVQVSLVTLTAELRLVLTCTRPPVLQSWPAAHPAISALDRNKQFSQCTLDPNCSTSTILVLPPTPRLVLSIMPLSFLAASPATQSCLPYPTLVLSKD